MTDFDAIYHQENENEHQDEEDEEDLLRMQRAEAIVIRGAGNMTIFGLSNAFETGFPTGLTARVAPEEFRATISRVNHLLRHHLPAVKMRFLICAGCVCCMCTGGCSLYPSVCLSGRARASLDKLLDCENRRLYHRLGLHWRLDKRPRCCQTMGENVAAASSGSVTLVEHVLLVEFLPRAQIYRPD